MPLPLHKQVEVLFSALNNRGITASLTRPGYLANKLNALLNKSKNGSFPSNGELNALYATASIEMWQRGVHSFLVSASLTNISPIWSSVAGYYASHYCMRAFAHAIGYFHLFQRGISVQLDLSGAFTCYPRRPKGKRGEHLLYWKIVKDEPTFISDPLFSDNIDAQLSDAAHRHKANYFDHLNDFPVFRTLQEQTLKDRIKVLSEMELSAVPTIDSDKYPDTDTVQIICYHRIVRFRQLLDDILGSSVRFWRQHRQPDWCSPILDFQVTRPTSIGAAITP